jgi:hypothetical protein
MTIGNLTLVFVGNVANDGTGDTLRQSFITTNNNMMLIGNTLGFPLGTTIVSNSSSISFGNVDTIIDSFGNATYRSARYIASISNSPNYQTSELLLVQDGLNVNCQVIGETVMGGNAATAFSANIVSGNVLLWTTGLSLGNTIKLQKIYIPV